VIEILIAENDTQSLFISCKIFAREGGRGGEEGGMGGREGRGGGWNGRREGGRGTDHPLGNFQAD
jgi:hypothetical protein